MLSATVWVGALRVNLFRIKKGTTKALTKSSLAVCILERLLFL